MSGTPAGREESKYLSKKRNDSMISLLLSEGNGQGTMNINNVVVEGLPMLLVNVYRFEPNYLNDGKVFSYFVNI